MATSCLTISQTCRASLSQRHARRGTARQTFAPFSHRVSPAGAPRPAAAATEGSPSPAPAPSRRQAAGQALLLALLAAGLPAAPADAIGFKKELKKKKIPVEDYSDLPNGLKFYDLTQGTGKVVAEGSQVTVHFDCIFRGIDVVSSRSARLLGGNRTIAEPFEFLAGQPVSAKRAAAAGDSAGGLFSGQGGPKPPPALSPAVLGMRVGGTRSVLVPPEMGYGNQGELEIGPGQSFELRIEVLSVA